MSFGLVLRKLASVPSAIIQRIVLKVVRKREMHSLLLRKIYAGKYGVTVGLYSYGCFDLSRVRPGVKIGRYCSISSTATILTRNHPAEFLTMHPVLYDGVCGRGVVGEVPFGHIDIEDDVWIGQNAVILPGVKRIGRGSIVGAGAVVTKDVPKYSVVVGVPARVIRARFDAATIDRVENSRWWDLSIDELKMLCTKDPLFVFNPGCRECEVQV